MPPAPTTLTAQLHQCIIVDDGELISAAMYPTRRARLDATVTALHKCYPGVDIDEVNAVLLQPGVSRVTDPNDFLLDDALGDIAQLYDAFNVDVHILPQDVKLSLAVTGA